MLYQGLLEKKAMVPADLLARYPLWQEKYPGIVPQNQLLSDQIFQFYAWHQFAFRHAQEEGRFPLWNPYGFTGQPLIGNAQSALYYPPNLLLLIFDPAVVSVVRAAFVLLMAGVFIYLLCRMYGLSRMSSLLGAYAVMLSGPMIVWLGHPHANVLALFPMMLWAAEGLLRNPSNRAWIALLGLAIGISILGGHPETTLHAGMLLGIYFLCRVLMLFHTRREVLARLGQGLIAVLLGLGIGAVQWMPFADLLLQSSTLANGGRGMAGGSMLYSQEWLANLATAVTLLSLSSLGRLPQRIISGPLHPIKITMNRRYTSALFRWALQ